MLFLQDILCWQLYITGGYWRSGTGCPRPQTAVTWAWGINMVTPGWEIALKFVTGTTYPSTRDFLTLNEVLGPVVSYQGTQWVTSDVLGWPLAAPALIWVISFAGFPVWSVLVRILASYPVSRTWIHFPHKFWFPSDWEAMERKCVEDQV